VTYSADEVMTLWHYIHRCIKCCCYVLVLAKQD